MNAFFCSLLFTFSVTFCGFSVDVCISQFTAEVHRLPSGFVHVYGVLSCHNGKEPLVALSALGPGMPTFCGVHGSPAHLNGACPGALGPGVGTLRLASGALL